MSRKVIIGTMLWLSLWGAQEVELLPKHTWGNHVDAGEAMVAIYTHSTNLNADML